MSRAFTAQTEEQKKIDTALSAVQRKGENLVMKTLVKAKHPGQKINGADRCHSRWGNDGWCDGVDKAKWLNSLGEDNEVYLKLGEQVITNGQVRQNWLGYTYDHLVIDDGGAK